MAGTSVPPVPHCRDLTPVGERLASRLYTAHSDRLGCPVTVTVYPPVADEETRRRFDATAASAQRLAAHPSVLTLHDWGHGADGRPWVVTDPQPPETIDSLLRAHGPLPVEQALRIGVLVAGAIETAHRAGIVHGDLSPARLVLGPQGEPLVADIGLAEFGDFPGFGALHHPIRYFAPPEVLERTGVTPASDVYSLATTVYALLAGSAPHEKPADITDSNASLLLRILQIRVPPIVRPGEDLDGVEAALNPALAHATDKRPPRVLDLGWSLQGVQRNLGLAVAEPVVLDLGNPERAAAAPPAVESSSAAAVPPRPDAVPARYTDSPPNPANTPGADLVHLFSDSPPDFAGRSHGATARHWATGLGHLGGHASEQVTGTPPGGLNGRGNGLRPAPIAGDDDDLRPVQRPPVDAARRRDPLGRPPRLPNAARRRDPQREVTGLRGPADADTVPTPRGSSAALPTVPRLRTPGDQATRRGRPRRPDPGGARSPSGAERPGSGAFPAAERTRSGSALDRARQARMHGSVRSTTGEPGPRQAAAEPPAVKAPASGGAPAVPVIVLI
ncbi:MAG: serine/threonine protein kinase, partial [Acidimicrobiales bacterium]